MPVVYISLVGSQFSALVNPLKSIIEQYQKPDHIYLLTTPHIKELKPLLIHELEKLSDLSFSQITEHTISESLKTDRFGNLPPHILISQIINSHENDMIIFNMTPGLKFQILSCIQTIWSRDVLILYAELDCIRVFKMSNGSLMKHYMAPLPKPFDVPVLLNLQGFTFNPAIKSREELFTQAVADLIEQFSEQNIPTLANIEIQGIVFDLVWNIGNTLRFITQITSQDEAKHLIAVVSGRHRFFELYHRYIYAFSKNSHIIERLSKDDSANKISVRRYTEEAILKAYFGKLLPKSSSRQPDKSTTPYPKQEKTRRINSNAIEPIRKNTVLLGMLATNMVPTLISIFSHRPERAVFFYAANNIKISQFKDQLMQNIESLPVNKLMFVPVSFTAEEILQLPACTEKNVEVNVGAGHKISGLFLTMWAAIHNAKLFSINNDTNRVEQIPVGESLVIQGPRPEFILTLSGNRASCEIDENKLLEKENEFQTILKFIALIKDNAALIRNFPDKTVQVESEGEHIVTETPNRWKFATIRIPGEKIVKIDISGGLWFEELVGYQLIKAGADSVSVRIPVPWSKKHTKRTGKTPPSCKS